jgi:hypothetical protein
MISPKCKGNKNHTGDYVATIGNMVGLNTISLGMAIREQKNLEISQSIEKRHRRDCYSLE